MLWMVELWSHYDQMSGCYKRLCEKEEATRAEPGSIGRRGRMAARKSTGLGVKGVASQLLPNWHGGFGQEC